MSLLGTSELVVGTPGDDLINARTSANEGEWLDAGLHMFVLGANVATAAIDPVGSVVRWAAEWALEHVGPLQSLLDGLVGSEEEVKACATQVAAVAGGLRASRADLHTIAPDEWSGEAARAHRLARREVLRAEGRVATALEDCESNLQRAAVVVALVRDYVRALLAEVIAAIARAAATSAVSAGLLAPTMAASAAVKVADAVAKARIRINQLVASLARLESMIGTWAAVALELSRQLRKVAPTLATPRLPDLRSALARMPETSPGVPSFVVLPLVSAIASTPDPAA